TWRLTVSALSRPIDVFGLGTRVSLLAGSTRAHIIRSSGAIQSVAYLLGEDVQRKGLPDEMQARIYAAVVNDGVAGIAACEQDSEAGPFAHSLLGKVSVVHFQHDNVGK